MPTIESQALNARVQSIQLLGRHEHRDSDGGGMITRVFWCQPYTAHKRVETALMGTVYPLADGGGKWGRAKPHADPLNPWYYCRDVQTEPMFSEQVAAARDTAFNPAAASPQYNSQFNSQFDSIQSALNTVDDLDCANLIENLSNAEIVKGGITNATGNDVIPLNTLESAPTNSINSFTSRGNAGARITATYLPLIFQPGISSSAIGNQAYAPQDPFDYVDPQREPITITTQMGRKLFFFSPIGEGNVAPPQLHGGVTDTYAHPEVIWRYTIRRLLVPFSPDYTMGLFANKINDTQPIDPNDVLRIGDFSVPQGCFRMEAPEVYSKRAPDGQVYWEILLKFLVRRLYDEYYQPDGLFKGFQKGWVGWNWALGTPEKSFVFDDVTFFSRLSYYPVCWNSGLFQFFGPNHPLFLNDSDVDMSLIANNAGLVKTLNGAPFQAGFYAGQ